MEVITIQISLWIQLEEIENGNHHHLVKLFGGFREGSVPFPHDLIAGFFLAEITEGIVKSKQEHRSVWIFLADDGQDGFKVFLISFSRFF